MPQILLTVACALIFTGTWLFYRSLPAQQWRPQPLRAVVWRPGGIALISAGALLCIFSLARVAGLFTALTLTMLAAATCPYVAFFLRHASKS